MDYQVTDPFENKCEYVNDDGFRCFHPQYMSKYCGYHDPQFKGDVFALMKKKHDHDDDM